MNSLNRMIQNKTLMRSRKWHFQLKQLKLMSRYKKKIKQFRLMTHFPSIIKSFSNNWQKENVFKVSEGYVIIFKMIQQCLIKFNKLLPSFLPGRGGGLRSFLTGVCSRRSETLFISKDFFLKKKKKKMADLTA